MNIDRYNIYIFILKSTALHTLSLLNLDLKLGLNKVYYNRHIDRVFVQSFQNPSSVASYMASDVNQNTQIGAF